MTKPFTGQIAVVTGASSGIGRAVAIALAEQGATVCLVGRNVETLEQSAAIARRTSSQVRCYRADLTQDDDLYRLVGQLQADIGCVDVLIHSAGAIAWGSVATSPITDLDQLYRTNVRAPYLLTQALLPMIRERGGQIVFMNSSIVNGVRAGVGAYAATKSALQSLAAALRAEVNGDGIRVLSVYPGRTATPTQEAAAQREGRAYEPDWLIQPADVASVVVHALLTPRTAEVTDVHIRPMRKS